MLTVSVTITGDKALQAKMRRLGKDLTNFSAALATTGADLKKYYADYAFASEGGIFGSPWPNLSPTYARWKAKRYPSKNIMVRTGNMQRGFRMYSDKTTLVIDNKEPYSKYHQSTQARNKMPYRPIMGVNKDVRSIVKRNFEIDIEKKLAKF